MGNTASVMASSGRYPLMGEVHVDEFLIGECEEGKRGRSSESKKKLVVVALEILEGEVGVGRTYAKVIDSASAKEFRLFFDTHISKEAEVVTDKWKGYLPLKNKFLFLKQ